MNWNTILETEKLIVFIGAHTFSRGRGRIVLVRYRQKNIRKRGQQVSGSPGQFFSSKLISVFSALRKEIHSVLVAWWSFPPAYPAYEKRRLSIIWITKKHHTDKVWLWDLLSFMGTSRVHYFFVPIFWYPCGVLMKFVVKLPLNFS